MSIRIYPEVTSVVWLEDKWKYIKVGKCQINKRDTLVVLDKFTNNICWIDFEELNEVLKLI